jgi:hypothetical protein
MPIGHLISTVPWQQVFSWCWATPPLITDSEDGWVRERKETDPEGPVGVGVAG